MLIVNGSKSQLLVKEDLKNWIIEHNVAVKVTNKLRSKEGAFMFLFLLIDACPPPILDLISAILEDPTCQKPSQGDIHAMKAAVGAIFTFSRLESHIYLFFQRLNSSKKKSTGRN